MKYVKKARRILVGEHEVARVIARPFVGDSADNFERTPNRKDFSVSPSKSTLLNVIEKSGGSVLGIGKIHDIFNGSGVTDSIHTDDNLDGIQKLIKSISGCQRELIFINLVDFDMKYGHRNDAFGYAAALEEFDSYLPDIINVLGAEDLLLITADHGCDPLHEGTDHTREYVPVLMYCKSNKKNICLGTRESFSDVGQTIAEFLKIPKISEGCSFLFPD